jgi:hypothetical protein
MEPTPRRSDRHLETCGRCATAQVHALGWEHLPGDLWLMELRCPNCGWTTEGVYERSEVRRFEKIVEAGRDELVREIERVREAAMDDDIARFVEALERDDILPFDF